VENPTRGELHALIRDHLHASDSPEARRSHSVLARNLAGLEPVDIRDAILGICALRDAGRIPDWQPEYGLRQAMRWLVDGRQLWDVALEHHRGQEKRAPLRTSAGPKRLGDVLGAA